MLTLLQPLGLGRSGASITAARRVIPRRMLLPAELSFPFALNCWGCDRLRRLLWRQRFIQHGFQSSLIDRLTRAAASALRGGFQHDQVGVGVPEEFLERVDGVAAGESLPPATLENLFSFRDQTKGGLTQETLHESGVERWGEPGGLYRLGRAERPCPNRVNIVPV